ncbi:uncharacterized protein BDV14DRAFT_182956 [Aspergillus stella-maris]|uniref:uncharacterized protein n=1 Tax=Aspergillus stella-maris TaxID=1810926 RepID=UPI003CCCDC9E
MVKVYCYSIAPELWVFFKLLLCSALLGDRQLRHDTKRVLLRESYPMDASLIA